MKHKIAMISRIILGLIYFVFGLNGFLNFIPPPPTPFPEAAMTFMGGMMAAPYFFPVLKGTETLCGLLLLSGFAAPLALVILAPITLQIFLFHSFMTPGLENSIMPVAMIALHILAATAYWALYRPLFSRRS
ncbi:DoxX family membrane protein [Bdellovibrio sp. 22V]|uniref:DoxX family membrane protein n=1 Tax=Bdellovibrio TaxID=958 RepID=UPI002543DD21|nr:DoxX family membrane protein [Bdellovibrio sp. 22V]WII70845.1 DoxX family membrane protein [Bdellovibrio sp. 22V]